MPGTLISGTSMSLILLSVPSDITILSPCTPLFFKLNPWSNFWKIFVEIILGTKCYPLAEGIYKASGKELCENQDKFIQRFNLSTFLFKAEFQFLWELVDFEFLLLQEGGFTSCSACFVCLLLCCALNSRFQTPILGPFKWYIISKGFPQSSTLSNAFLERADSRIQLCCMCFLSLEFSFSKIFLPWYH